MSGPRSNKDRWLKHLGPSCVPDRGGPPTGIEQRLFEARDCIAALAVSAQRRGKLLISTASGGDISASEPGRKEYTQKDPVARTITHDLHPAVGDGKTRVSTPTTREDF